MIVKVEKYVYIKMADVIFTIDCTEKNILKTLDLLPLKDVVVEIGDVKTDDVLFEKIKQLNLEHTTSLEGKSSYFGIVFVTSIEQFKELVKYIFESDSESFAITSIDDKIQCEQYLYNKVPIRKLIKQGKVDVNISVAIQESTVSISLSKEAYNTSKLSQKSKEIKRMF